MTIPICQLDTEELWSEFLITRSDRLRDELIKRYIPFASKIALYVASTVDTSICPAEDMQSAAMAAMITCVDKFDEKVGYSEKIDRRFIAYARQRIHCACIDEFRMHCWVSPRSNMSKKWGIRPLSYEDWHTEETSLEDTLDFADIIDVINSNKCNLSEDERFILKSVYFNGMTQNEIGEAIGLTGTAVYNRKRAAFTKIKKYISKQRQERLLVT